MTAGHAISAARSANCVPLCVDLDGTLIKTDTLLESLFVLLREQPVCFLLLPFWLLRGKAYLKRQIGLRAQLDVGLLPQHADFVSYLREQVLAGRPIYLATACDQALANAVGQHPLVRRSHGKQRCNQSSVDPQAYRAGRPVRRAGF